MKVHELIELLEDCDEDAEVFLLEQPRWPFEYSVAGVAVRKEVEEGDDEEGDADDQTERERGTADNDVFILEGRQLRYAPRGAWRARRG